MSARERGSHEFRVVWQRLGLGKRVKLYQTRAGAERFVRVLRGDAPELDGRDPDEQVCCSGWECGCRGVTVEEQREAERALHESLPSFVVEPFIESRAVGVWTARVPRLEPVTRAHDAERRGAAR